MLVSTTTCCCCCRRSREVSGAMPRDFLPRMRVSPCQYCFRQHPTPPHARYFQRQQLRADYATFVRLYRVQTVWRPCGLCKNTHACFLRFSNRSPNICFPTRPPASGIAAIVEFAQPRRVNMVLDAVSRAEGASGCCCAVLRELLLYVRASSPPSNSLFHPATLLNQR